MFIINFSLINIIHLIINKKTEEKILQFKVNNFSFYLSSIVTLYYTGIIGFFMIITNILLSLILYKLIKNTKIINFYTKKENGIVILSSTISLFSIIIIILNSF